MVTSVSTDWGRRQRLQSKSHIQAPAAMPNTRAGILAFPLSPAEQRKQDRQRKTILSSFLADVWLLKAHHCGK